MSNLKPCCCFLIICILILISCSRYSATRNAGSESSSEFYRGITATPDWYNPADIDTLRIATWNVEHFVDSNDNPYIDNDRENNPPPDMEQRRRLLSKAIQKLNADIIVFEEFESNSYLRQFSNDNFPDMNYNVFAALESADWYMNVVMMSRIPLGAFNSYGFVNTPIPGQTNEEGNPASQTFINNRMWTADVLVKPDYSFSLTGLHLKAGRGARNEAWRQGQIQLLRGYLSLLMENDSDKNMLVMGDLNMTPESDEFKLLLGDRPPRFSDPLKGSGSFSHPSDSLFWRIDHLLPNRQMQGELVPGSTTVARPLPLDQMIQISDHLPVIATFVPQDR